MLLGHKKIGIFALTCWGYGAVDSTISAYAMTKEYLAQEMDLNQTFLGLVDSVTTIGTILGVFIMIRLTHNIRRNYLTCALLHFLCFVLLIPIAKLYTPLCNTKPLLLVCTFFSGVCKAAIVFPQILFSSHFDSREEQYHLNVWYGLTFLGDTAGILVSKLIIEGLGLGWEVNLVFFGFSFIAVAVCIYLFVPEPEEQEEEQEQTLATTWSGMKGFLSTTANKLIAADYVLEEILFFNIMLWMPYYFYLHDLQHFDYLATLAFPIAMTIGAVLFEDPLTRYAHRSRQILTLMISVNAVAFFIMFITPLQASTAYLYIILLAGSGLIMGTPYSRVCSGDPAEVCQGNQRKIHMAFFTVNLLRELAQAIANFFIGFFLQRDMDSLQYINFLNCLLIVAVGVMRRYIWAPILTGSNKSSLEIQLLAMNKLTEPSQLKIIASTGDLPTADDEGMDKSI